MLKKFKINIILRITLIALLLGGINYTLLEGFYLTGGFLFLITLIALIGLTRYVNQTNRDVANFVAGIQFDDFTTTNSAHHKGKAFGEMYDVFNLVNQKFRAIRAEKEANHQFLQSLVELVDIGLICLDEQGEVVLMNKALQRLIRKSYLVNLHSLEKVYPDLAAQLKKMEPGSQDLVKLNIQQQMLQLSIRATGFKLQEKNLRLFSIQNIQEELEEQEIIAWQKLIRILTHEIMNSVAPIVSLSGTIEEMLAEDEAPLEEGSRKHIQHGVAVIRKRGENLLNFTETYRTLTRIPPPNFRMIEGNDLLDQVATLLTPELQGKRIGLEVRLPGYPVTLEGDPGLLEQVLINLIRNARDALTGEEGGKILLSIQKNPDNRVVIEVADNGPGIEPGMLDQIFVPFYTTKEEGSGIGLSLSRQIMRMHKGRIEVFSKPGEGARFVLTL